MGNLYQTDISGNTFCQKLGIKIPTQYISGLLEVGAFTAPSQNVNTGAGTSTLINPPNTIWQSFTTTAAGQLFSVQWDFSVLPPNGGYIARLYSGNGIGGTLLASLPVSASGSGTPYTAVIDFSSVLFQLANSTQYTIALVPNSGTANYTLSTLTGYSGGQSNQGAGTSYPVRVYTGSLTNYFSIDNSGNAQFLNTVAANISGNAATATLAATATIANSVAENSVTNAELAQMPANTVKANITGSPANASDVTLASFKTWLSIGSIGANQIAFGNASSVLSGDSNLTYQSLGSVNTILLNSGTLNLGGAGSNTDGKKISIYDPNATTSPTNRYQHTGFGTTNGTLEVELYDNTKSVQFYVATSSLTRTNIASLSGSGVFTASQGLFSGLKGVSIGGTTPSVSVGSNAEFAEATGAGNFATNAAIGDAVLRTSSGQALRLLAGGATSVLDITSSLANLNFPLTLPQTQAGAPVTGSVKSNFEYFEENNTFTTATTGAIVFSSFSIKFLRINQKVFMFLQDFSQNATSSAAIIASSAIPAKFIPTVTKQCIIEGQRGANRRSISVQISNTGIVTIFGDETGGNFNNGQIAAYFGEPAIYSLN